MTQFIFNVCFVLAIVFIPAGVLAQNDGNHPAKSPAQRAAEAAQNLTKQQKFQLQYRFKPGEEIRWDVEHVATTKAQISGKHETTSSRTQSTKLWKVSSIDAIGNITFVHSVESSKFWQQIGDNEPISFDTQSSENAPEEFAMAVEKIGKPLAVVTISPSGQVVDRKDDGTNMNFGVGDICAPLPKNPIAVGHKWFVPTEFDATDEDGKRLKLKARINYELTKIVDGMAVISFKTEILTPVENDQIRSQLLQKLNIGYIAFNIEKGRLNTKEVKWNEKVQEYAGPDSFLQYIGRMTEQIVATKPDNKSRISKANANVIIKRPGDKPIIRK